MVSQSQDTTGHYNTLAGGGGGGVGGGGGGGEERGGGGGGELHGIFRSVLVPHLLVPYLLVAITATPQVHPGSHDSSTGTSPRRGA